MKAGLRMRLALLIASASLSVCAYAGQNLTCEEVTAIAGAARSTSKQSLLSWKEKAGESYTAQLVSSFRLFELEPAGPGVAARLLSLIPPSKDEEPLWGELDSYICDQESERDLMTLAKLHSRMPRDIARAVLRVPGKMREYVGFAATAVQDPHNDYAVRMEPVCRARHRQFLGAVDSLTPEAKQWFLRKVFDSRRCRAIALPEAG